MRELLFLLACGTALAGAEYFEGFDRPGTPAGRDGLHWEYLAELSEAEWKTLIPGDGFAYLQADRSALNAAWLGSGRWPFQVLSVGPVSPGHRISMRAKDAVIPGLAGQLFTYREEEGTIQEIDVEIVAEDAEFPGREKGGTDLRLNVWLDQPADALRPRHGFHQLLRDVQGRPVSHQDGRFHIYTIEWKDAEVRFYADGVLQAVSEDAPASPARVIFGLRQTPWAGRSDWAGSRAMTVDWIVIEPLDPPTIPST